MTTNDWEDALWRNQQRTTLNAVDLQNYDRKIKEWVKSLLSEYTKSLEAVINTEIERVCRDQDERCITELCKILDEKLEEFRESMWDEYDGE